MFKRLLQATSSSRRRFSSNMRVVGLVSGGKDSCFNLLKCVAENHEVVALANLHPADPTIGELDSHMYQTVGHEVIESVAKALDLPLHRRALQGKSLHIEKNYSGPVQGDEVEDLYELLREVKEAHNIQGVSVGAVLSDYQRVRVENVCSRLGLTSLAYLWCYDQMELLKEMIDCQMQAVMVKVAAMGLVPEKHLNKPLSGLVKDLAELNKTCELNVCGEGGEYESLTLDCPLYNSKIIIEESEVVYLSKSNVESTAYLKINKHRLEPKPAEITAISWADRVKQLPIKTSSTFTQGFLCKVPKEDVVSFAKKECVNVVSSWPEEHKTVIKSTGNELFCSLDAASTGDVSADTTRLMDQLKDILTQNSFDFSDIVYTLLYINDMSQFANINAVYTKYFGINPPTRICVEAALPASSLFHAKVLCSHESKVTRHVQGVSHWAPSCIGPYSQCAKVGSRVYVSGQIPLVPGCMTPLPTGFAGQCQLALDHVLSVGAAMGVSQGHMVTAHCYVHREEDVAYALGAGVVGPRVAQEVQPLCVVVPRLPKDVLVEWHINFDLDNRIPHCVSTGGDKLEAISEKLGVSLRTDNLYYMFYSASTIDINQLLQALSATNLQLIPIPVSKVVSNVDQLSDKYQVSCVQVLGYSV